MRVGRVSMEILADSGGDSLAEIDGAFVEASAYDCAPEGEFGELADVVEIAYAAAGDDGDFPAWAMAWVCWKLGPVIMPSLATSV